MELIRTGVRTLVEHTLREPDIRPQGASLKAMREGALGHKARQALLPAGWQAEVPLELAVPIEEEEWGLLLTGRMDAFLDGEMPQVEELKLWQPRVPPEEPVPAHMAQAVCYGHMLCETRGCALCEVRVVYVDTKGRVLASFDGPSQRDALRERFMALLEPYARRLRLVRAHERARDASLHALPFPYETYRPGQRELAVQVYTAIRRGRRLFASMPTGTGKSAAALYPALKALGEGHTGRVYYLTARTTQRQGALDALALMRRHPLHLWALTLDAKDRQCPQHTLCHPDFCPRAKGHYLREQDAVDELLREDDWSPDRIAAVAEARQVCPFELSLALAELADLTVCDLNYALDPAVHIQRVFDRTSDVTLLIDEAHELPDRAREMLSGAIDGGRIRRLRTVTGRALGRKHRLYQAMTAVLRALEDLPVEDGAREGRLASLPRSLTDAAQSLADELLELGARQLPWEEVGERLTDTLSPLLGFTRALRRDPEGYAFLWQGGRDRTVTAYALDISGYLAEVTERLRGVVFFSATLEPLPAMARLLGGGEEDACFSAPSPFPPERLLVLRHAISTRYRDREQAAQPLALLCERAVRAHPGRYIVFFPSFAMLRQAEPFFTLPHQTQRPGLSIPEREAFLRPYHEAAAPCLSLCVLGGIFAEGIDLPGRCLDGVIVIGLGLPQNDLFRETLRGRYQETLGDGFLYAYLIPGLQKVAQAVGRVIRGETDRGIAVLLDDRYSRADVRALLPAHWQVRPSAELRELAAFWAEAEPSPGAAAPGRDPGAAVEI